MPLKNINGRNTSAIKATLKKSEQSLFWFILTNYEFEVCVCC